MLEQAKKRRPSEARRVYSGCPVRSSWYRGKRIGTKMYNCGPYTTSGTAGEQALACQKHKIQHTRQSKLHTEQQLNDLQPKRYLGLGPAVSEQRTGR